MTAAAWSRTAPFAAFLGLIGIGEGWRFANRLDLFQLGAPNPALFYGIRITAVVILLVFFRKKYREIDGRELAAWRTTLLSLVVGGGIFVLWIKMDWLLPGFSPLGFDPATLQSPAGRVTFIAMRLTGAALVVPVMEELFWRSFLLRYLIHTEFTRVRLGTFSWGSFWATSVFFALEHHYILAGLMAGVILNLLMYFTRSLSQCILAHATANLALGLYVLQTGRWQFW